MTNPPHPRRKGLFYPLLATVVSVWSLVLYQVGAYLLAPETETTEVQAQHPDRPPTLPATKPNGSPYARDFRDPFRHALTAAGSGSPRVAPPKTATTPQPAAETAETALPLRLQGIVGSTAILATNDGQVHFAKAGSTIAGARVQRITVDEVTLRWNRRAVVLALNK